MDVPEVVHFLRYTRAVTLLFLGSIFRQGGVGELSCKLGNVMKLWMCGSQETILVSDTTISTVKIHHGSILPQQNHECPDVCSVMKEKEACSRRAKGSKDGNVPRIHRANDRRLQEWEMQSYGNGKIYGWVLCLNREHSETFCPFNGVLSECRAGQKPQLIGLFDKSKVTKKKKKKKKNFAK